VGVGWSLTGFSSITYCGKSVASDGVTAGIHYGPGDNFCLDGQKLVAVQEGAYGADGTHYRTEQDVYADVISVRSVQEGIDAPNRFVVRTKNGRLLTYNGRKATRVRATNGDSGTLEVVGEVYAVWLLDAEEDRAGNKMTYEYTMGGVFGTYAFAYQPTRILYTSHSSGAVAHREVRFTYELRNDWLSHWHAGVRQETLGRLTAIAMYAPHPTSTQLVWRYNLGYEYSPTTHRSRVIAVQRCAFLPDDADADTEVEPAGCLWAKQFDWYDGSALPQFVAQPRIPAPVHYHVAAVSEVDGEVPAMQLMDLNGDGATDVLFASGAVQLWEDNATQGGYPLPGEFYGPAHTAFVSKRSVSGALVPLGQQHSLSRDEPLATAHYGHVRLEHSLAVDLNGDGVTELWAAIDNRWDADATPATGCLWRHMRWAGDSFERLADYPCVMVGTAETPNGFKPRYMRQAIQFVDLNGDGLPDQMREVNAKGWVPVHPDDPEGEQRFVYDPVWASASNHATSPGTLEPAQTTSRPARPGFVLDLDGDGSEDIVNATEEGGSGASSTVLPPAGASRQFGDFNGDGLPDLLVIPGHGHGTSLATKLYWNTGNGFYRSSILDFIGIPSDTHPDQAQGLKTRYDDRGIRVVDVNRDGRADIVSFHSPNAHSTQITFLLSKGNGTFERHDRDVVKGTRIDAKHWLNEDERPFKEYQGRTPEHETLMTGLTVGCLIPIIGWGACIGAGINAEETVTLKDYADDSEVPGLAAGWSLAQLGDFNGDGAIDIVRHVPNPPGQVGELELELQIPEPRDVLATVKDEPTLWTREKVIYATEWSNDPTDKIRRDPCAYPLQCLRGGLTVVRAVQTRAHLVDPQQLADWRTYEYAYEDPVVDVRGRGFLGFGEFAVWDAGRPQLTITTYNHRTLGAASGTLYPGAGRPETITTIVPLLDQTEVALKPMGARARMTRTVQTYLEVGLNADKTFAVIPFTTTTYEWEQGVLIDWGAFSPGNGMKQHVYYNNDVPPPSVPRRLHTLFGYDYYGNQTYQRQQAMGADGEEGHLTEETIVYETDPTAHAQRLADWLISLPLKHTLKSRTTAAATPVVRTTDFHHTPIGQLDMSMVEKETPNNADLFQSTSLVYNSYGLPTMIKRTAANLPDARVSHIEYEQLYPGAPDEKIFPSQQWMEYKNPRCTVDCRPTSWTVLHPAYGLPIATMNVNGVQATTTYDALGRPHVVQTDGQQPVTMAYSGRLDRYGAGNQNGLVVTAPTDERTTDTSTDARGLTIKTRTTDFHGGWVDTDSTYDLLGRLSRRANPSRPDSAPQGFTRYTHDSLDRLKAVLYPDESTIRQTYPNLFEIHTYAPSSNPLNPSAENHRYAVTDLDGRVTQRIEMLQNGTGGGPITTTYTYAPFGLVEDVRDHAGNTTHFAYDRLGRRTTITTPDRGTTAIKYTGFGEVREECDATGALTTHVHDALGRVTATTTVDGTNEFQWDINPHGVGQLAWAAAAVAAGRPRNVTYFDYDPFGRLNQRSIEDYTDLNARGEPRYYRRNMTYDPVSGRLATVTYPDVPGQPRLTARYDYNPHGFLQGITDATPGQTPKPLWTAVVRDLTVTQDVLGNGVTLTNDFDPLMRRLQYRYARKGATSLMHLTYAYHRNGLVQSRLGTNDQQVRKETFHYDSLQRLTQWELDYKVPGAAGFTSMLPRQYLYDALGNLTHIQHNQIPLEFRTYGKPDGSQPHTLTAIAHVNAAPHSGAYVFDVLGRQISGGGRRIAYTAFDLPKTVTHEGVTWTFEYDAFGRRIKKSGPHTTTFYLPEGQFERRTQGRMVTDVFHVGPAQVSYTEPTAHTAATTVVRYPLTDQLGSTHLVTLDDGTIERGAYLYYEPFGGRINADGSAFLGTIGAVKTGLTGHEYDDAFGLVNMQGRMFNPATKHFLSPDPIVVDARASQAWHPYSYALNSPLNFTDPSGFLPCGVWVQQGPGPWTWQPHPQDWCGSGGTASTSTSWAEAGARANGASFYGNVSQGIGRPKPNDQHSTYCGGKCKPGQVAGADRVIALAGPGLAIVPTIKLLVYVLPAALATVIGVKKITARQDQGEWLPKGHCFGPRECENFQPEFINYSEQARVARDQAQAELRKIDLLREELELSSQSQERTAEIVQELKRFGPEREALVKEIQQAEQFLTPDLKGLKAIREVTEWVSDPVGELGDLVAE
jgi:RHS repeat-associated protein